MTLQQAYRRGASNACLRFGLEKTAILGTLALGAGLHAGANAINKHFFSSPLSQGSRLAAGLSHALEGRQMSPWARRLLQFGVGPEAMEHYGIGQALGQGMQGLSKGDQYRSLKKLRKLVATSPELSQAPVSGGLVPAINQVLGNSPNSVLARAPTVPLGAPERMIDKVVPGLAGAAALAAAPHAAVHLGINAARHGIAESAAGQKFMREGFRKGVGGALPSPMAQAAMDYGLSPAALDTQRLGYAARKFYERDPVAAARASTLVANEALGMPKVQQHMQQMGAEPTGLQGLLQRVRGTQAPA